MTSRPFELKNNDNSKLVIELSDVPLPIVAEGATHNNDWNGPNDIRNPKNWKFGMKVFHSIIPCCISFEITFTISTIVPATSLVAERFSITHTQSLLTLTLYTLGLAFGPLFLAPLSEVFGRRVLYIFTLSCLLFFTGIGTIVPSFAGLLICRFLGGFLGSAGMAMGAGSAADLWQLQTAGGRVGVFFILSPFAGPILGPLVGAAILESQDRDWRWTQWIVLIIGGPMWIGAILMKETSKTSILLRHNRLKSVSAHDTLQRIMRGVLRSIKLLTTDIIVFSLSIYTAYVYALIFGYFQGVPYVFVKSYGFSQVQSALTFLAILIGYFLAILLFIVFDSTLYARKRRTLNGEMPDPECRLYSALVGSVFISIGLFWFAWTANEQNSFTVIASGIPFGLGAFALFLSTVNYLVDVYQSAYAASAIAANGVLRFTLGAVFPLFMVQTYESLTVRWAGTLFACLSLLLLPIPWLLMRYGPRLRARRSVII